MLRLWKSGGIRFSFTWKSQHSDLCFLLFWGGGSTLSLLSEAVTADCVRLIGVCMSLKWSSLLRGVVLRSSVTCVSLAPALREWLVSSKESAMATAYHHLPHHQRALYLKPLELGWINVLMAETVTFDFLWCYSHPLGSTVGCQNFCPRHYFKDSTPYNLQCLLVYWLSM